MIVIATNNGLTYLPRLLSSFEKFGTGGQKVLIVDTGSIEEPSLKYLEELKENKAYFVEKITGGFDSGAYIWAYKNYVDENYIFMHDSCEILSSDWVDAFIALGKPVCAYASFTLGFDEAQQRTHLTNLGLHFDYINRGIFGPIFFAKREALDALGDLTPFIPLNKINQRGMERGWAALFANAGIDVGYLSYIPNNTINDENIFFRTLKKYSFTRRQ